MDLDAYVMRHRGGWDRLATLVTQRRLSGREADELVWLYQKTATNLSVARSQGGDPALIGYLSSLVAQARAAISGKTTPVYREIAGFFTQTFPAMLYRSRWWWIGVMVASCAVALLLGIWVARSPAVQQLINTQNADEVKQLVEHDFENYYSEYSAQSFTLQVWTNNAWVAAIALIFGALILPAVWVLWQNMANLGVVGGLMAVNGKLDLFFGLIAPHGLLEMTCVFVAAGAGLRLGWAWMVPGPRSRLRAFAEEGRATITLALGLVVVLLVTGVIEGFVVRIPLATWTRITIGVSVWLVFMVYVFTLGRRAARAGVTGDLEVGQGDLAPQAG